MQKKGKKLKESDDDLFDEYVRNRGVMPEVPSPSTDEQVNDLTVSDNTDPFNQVVAKIQLSEPRKVFSSEPGNLVSRVKSLRLTKDLYEVMSRGEKCYFCDNEPTNTYYKPLLQDVKDLGPHRDMKAYKVCTTCCGRLDKKRSFNHNEITDYIKPLVARGSVGGRITHHALNSLHEAVVRIPEGTLAEAMNGTFKFIEGSTEKMVDHVIMSNGATLVFLKPC